MVDSNAKGGKPVLRSRLRELLAVKMREEGRKILGEDVAKEAGINKGTVSSWMSPEPFIRVDYPTAKALGAYFNLPWYEMVEEDIIPDEPSPN